VTQVHQSTADIRIIGLDGIPEVQPGDNIADFIATAVDRSGHGLETGDILVITHKIVSKAEGRLVDLRGIEPSEMARAWAERYGKDARQVEVVLRESTRIVKMDRGVLIAETKHGFICANAAVDASNVAPDTVCLLPEDPDRSAARLRMKIGSRFGFTETDAPGVIVSDSFGRPWRQGIVNVAVGVAGLAPLADYRGQYDAAGYELHVSVLAVADELAAAAELVMNKLDARPVVLIRGYTPPTGAPHGTGRDLVLDPARDLFR
jgi:coenzyme F420-0:L-glutamate ligase/coenzyme F420-1:gamma-L-glutamate ligase